VSTILRKTAAVIPQLAPYQNITTVLIDQSTQANVGGGKVSKKAQKRSVSETIIATKSNANAHYMMLLGADSFRSPETRQFAQSHLQVLTDDQAVVQRDCNYENQRKRGRRSNHTTMAEIAALLPGPGEGYDNHRLGV
jgi:hypothetical protein